MRNRSRSRGIFPGAPCRGAGGSVRGGCRSVNVAPAFNDRLPPPPMRRLTICRKWQGSKGERKNECARQAEHPIGD